MHYSIEHSARELAEVIEHLAHQSGRRKLVLLGHSWGGQVVLEWLLRGSKNSTHSDHVAPAGCVVTNAPLDQRSYEARQRELRQALDPEISAFLEEEEEKAPDSVAYATLVGKSETQITGSMEGWSALERLRSGDWGSTGGGVLLRCMFIVGERDTVPTEDYRLLQELLEERRGRGTGTESEHKGLPLHAEDSQVLVINGAEHAPFLEKGVKEKWFAAVENFLEMLYSRQGQ